MTDALLCALPQPRTALQSPAHRPVSRAVLLLGLAAALGLSACVPAALVGGAAGAGALLISSDRRSGPTQEADTQLEVAARDTLQANLIGRGNVSVSSYYRKLLITGEVPNEQDRQLVHQWVSALPGHEGVHNELAVMPESSVSSRSSDALLAGRVRTALLQANGVPSGSIKVVVERGTVYLMGRLTPFETQLATDVVRQMGGVQRVVRVVDYIAPQGGGTGALGAGTPVNSPVGAPLGTTHGTPVGSGSGMPVGGAPLASPQPVQPAVATQLPAGSVTPEPAMIQPLTQPVTVQPSGTPLEVRTLPPAR